MLLYVHIGWDWKSASVLIFSDCWIPFRRARAYKLCCKFACLFSTGRGRGRCRWLYPLINGFSKAQVRPSCYRRVDLDNLDCLDLLLWIYTSSQSSRIY